VSGGLPIATGVGGHVRPAFENIRDINLIACEFHRRKHFGEKISRSADKRFALLVLICPRRFSYKHQASFRIAYSEDNLRAAFGEVRADLALESFGAQSGQTFRFCSYGGDGRSGDGLLFLGSGG
jgi:hypothetical protein